jgi:hypothetical protein
MFLQKRMSKYFTRFFAFVITAASLSAALPLQLSNFASPAYWAMAHSGGAITEIRNAYWLNPAIYPHESSYSITLNEAFLPGTGISISELSGHYSIRPGRALISGLNMENYGRFDGRNTEGELTGEFSASQYQYFLGYTHRVSARFSGGLQLVLFGNRIDQSREHNVFLRYGLSYTLGKRDNILAFSGVTDGLENRWRVSFSHELEYLPLRLNLDFRWYGDDWDPASFRDPPGEGFDFGTALHYFAEKLTIGAYIRAAENLNLMAGLDLARLNLNRNAFGLDTIISGIALGAQYRLNEFEFSLGLYHYAHFTTMTALGISYLGK